VQKPNAASNCHVIAHLPYYQVIEFCFEDSGDKGVCSGTKYIDQTCTGATSNKFGKNDGEGFFGRSLLSSGRYIEDYWKVGRM